MGRSLRSAPASRSRLSTKLNDDQTQLYWRLAIIEVLALLRTSRAAFNVLRRVFPNLIAVATRRKQVSSFLKRSSILSIAQHFGPHFIILPDAVVLSDPSNFGKHSAERSLPVLLRSVKKTAPAPSETHCDAFSVRTSPGLNCVNGCQLVIYFPSTLDSPQEATSASLIGRSGSSTFRLSAAAVSMSLTGSRFSSESAPRPFHYGIRG
jgi:hypothetical protein